MKGSSLRIWILPVILVLTAGLYREALANGYVWDDFLLFVDNVRLRTGPISWDMLSRPLLEGTTYWRPAALLTFALEFRIFGVDASASHLINLCIHLLNTSLVYALARQLASACRLGLPEWRAATAALVYAWHPVMVESAGWISGRFDLMVTSFVLAALAADASIAHRGWRAFAICLLFALALGSKETALALPPVLFLMRLARIQQRDERDWRAVFSLMARDWPTVAGLGLVFLGWILLRLASFDALLHVEPFVAEQTARPDLRALLVLNALYFYLGEVLVPFARIAPHHPLVLSSLLSPEGLLHAGLALAALLALIYTLFRRTVTGYLLAAGGFALLPVLQLIPLTNGGNIGNDRFLTLPLAFVALAVCVVQPLSTRVLRRPLQVTLAAAILLTWTVMAAASVSVTIPLWRNQLTLWSWAYQQNPDFEPAQSGYLSAAMRSRRPDLAAPVFERLLAQGPLRTKQQILYGMYLRATGQHEEAERHIRSFLIAYEYPDNGSASRGARAEPGEGDKLMLSSAHSTLGAIYMTQHRYEEALAELDQAMRYAPGAAYYQVQRGLVLLALDRVEEGEQAFTSGLDTSIPQYRRELLSERERFLAELCAEDSGRTRKVCEPPVINQSSPR